MAESMVGEHVLPQSREGVNAYNSESDSDEEFTCAICQEYRLYLKKLPCNHLFCEYCLQELVNRHNDRDFPCPLCRAMTPIPRGGASGFKIELAPKRPDNVEELDEVAAVAAACENKYKRVCDECEEECRVYSCLQCKMVLCHLCESGHQGNDHTLVKLQEVSAEFRREAKTLSSLKCQKHARHRLIGYCQTCKDLVCTPCIAADHARHVILDLTPVTNEARKSIAGLQTLVEEHIRMVEAGSEEIEYLVKNVQEDHARAKEDIQRRADEMRQVISHLENASLGSLDDLSKLVINRYDHELRGMRDMHAGLTAISTHLTSVLAEGTSADIIRFEVSAREQVGSTKHLQKFTEGLPVLGINIQNASDCDDREAWGATLSQYMKFPHAVCSVRDLPVVKVTPTVVCSNDPQTVVFSMCPNGDGEIWVAFGGGHDSTQTTVGLFNANGVLVKADYMDGEVKLVTSDQHSIFAVSKTDCKQLFSAQDPWLLQPCWWFDYVKFAKKARWGCMLCSNERCQIISFNLVFNDSLTLQENAVDLFWISAKQPLALDVSNDTSLFAVVDINHNINLYHRRRFAPHATFPPKSKELDYRVVDVCFYRLYDGEVLLAVDTVSQDILMLEANKELCFLRRLAGDLKCLVGAMVLCMDERSNAVVVGCHGGRVLKCRGTCTKV